MEIPDTDLEKSGTGRQQASALTDFKVVVVEVGGELVSILEMTGKLQALADGQPVLIASQLLPTMATKRRRSIAFRLGDLGYIRVSSEDQADRGLFGAANLHLLLLFGPPGAPQSGRGVLLPSLAIAIAPLPARSYTSPTCPFRACKQARGRGG